ncbi:hypothetical protein NBRC111894_3156 [Sporolactobacillus inulinus]|uniref:Lipoprotein n=1 Tax=Sporolactobacillus inulinus TaxID=2078 RepID=A0A4Y1ZEK3_9BACL|nr:hypothetical protein [Sporolactobacillus inulinus]GAY77602.1 hypothetical protein NBRC111894_3156 [Sporolactobacillus inulinus]
MKWKKTAAAISILLALQLILSGCWFNASKDSKVKTARENRKCELDPKYQ